MDRERLTAVFRALGVPARQATANAINICCPLCSIPDTNYHCGVFVSNLRFHCWRCKRTGTLRRLLGAAGCGDLAIDRALAGSPEILGKDRPLTQRVKAALGLRKSPPTEASSALADLPPSDPVTPAVVAEAPALRRFLAGRRISIDTCREYDARWAGNVGQYAHRLVLPVYGEDGRLAAWQARDVTGQARAKYLTCGHISKLLYWTDLVRRGGDPWRWYVVEGVFDAWRMAYNTVATFTHGLSRAQRGQLLADDRAEEVVFAWDGDSWELSKAAARSLAPLVRAGAARLPVRADPDRLGRERMMELAVEWA